MPENPLPPALILTAGLGTRLAPLTHARAKPAVPVVGVPIILRVLRWLAEQEIHSVVLNLHHLPHTITEVVGHGNDLDLRVRYSWESTILGSAGGIRLALSILGKRFFVINGDTLVNVNLRDLQQTHERTAADVTLAITDHPLNSRYGGVAINKTGFVRKFCTPGVPSQHFVGVQLTEASVFERLPVGIPASTVGGLYDNLLLDGSGQIATHYFKGHFYEVGTPADYLQTSLEVAQNEGHMNLPTGKRNHIHPTANITRTILWDDVVIGKHTRLTDCIVTDGVCLPDHTMCAQEILIKKPHGFLSLPLNR